MAEMKCLHWMQRITLTRHNLHAASRTSDFTFFKTLQAQAFLEGTDYVAILTTLLGNDADTVLHALDDLNAGMAYVHQDAFKTVYDNIRASIAEEGSSRRAKTVVDVSQQKQVAHFGIDKMANAAVALIENQPTHCQDAVANVWLIGATIIADAVQVCLSQIDKLENQMDDFILLEYSWQMVQTATEASVSALRGVFNLMASSESGSSMLNSDRSMNGLSESNHHGRSASMSSTTSSLLKRLSTVLSHPHAPPAPPSSVRTSFSYSNPHTIRSSISHSFPMNMPAPPAQNHAPPGHTFQRKLSTIPPTPFEVSINPFDMSFKRYDTAICSPHSSTDNDHSESSSAFPLEQTLQEEHSPLDMDPMGSAAGSPAAECKPYNNPTFFRRLSRENGMTPIAV